MIIPSTEPELSAETLEILQLIVDMTDYKLMVPYSEHPAKGQLVVTGPIMRGSLHRQVGFCVQVRKKVGAFGSDMVLLRHADDRLMVHENQSFFALTESQMELAQIVFGALLAEEDFDHGYQCYNKVLEKGFVIEASESRTSAQVEPVTLTVDHGDGRKTITTFVG